jgi:23S rRNA pseudouridine2605 synthase
MTIEKIRLSKFLSAAGISSRREAEKLIANGEISVNNKIITEQGTKVSPKDTIKYKGKIITPQNEILLYKFNKPKGIITTKKDEKSRPTIYKYLPKNLSRLLYIGRLDKDTEGLLLLTNNGDLKRKLELPTSKIPRKYEVKITGQLTKSEIRKIEKGINIEGFQYKPAKIKHLDKEKNQLVEITLLEGKNREIRKIFDHLSHPVINLKRTEYANIKLKNLKPGKLEQLKLKDLKCK